LPGQWHLGCNYSIHTLPLPILDTIRGQILNILDIYPHMTPYGAIFFICWKMLPGQWHLGCNYSIHTLPLPILDTLRGQILNILDIYPYMTPSGAKFFICWRMRPGQKGFWVCMWATNIDPLRESKFVRFPIFQFILHRAIGTITSPHSYGCCPANPLIWEILIQTIAINVSMTQQKKAASYRQP